MAHFHGTTDGSLIHDDGSFPSFERVVELTVTDAADTLASFIPTTSGLSFSKQDGTDTVASVALVRAALALAVADGTDTLDGAADVAESGDVSSRPSHRHGGDWIVGAHVHDGGALGVLGSTVPDEVAGSDGPALLFNEVATHALEADEVSIVDASVSEGYTLFVYDDSSFDITGPSGVATITYAMKINGELQAGTAEATVAFPVLLDSLVLLDAPDTLEATSSLQAVILDLTKDDTADTVSSGVQLPLVFTLSADDGTDTLVSAFLAPPVGSVAVEVDAVDDDDTVAAQALAQLVVSAAVTDAADTITSAMGRTHFLTGASALVQASCTAGAVSQTHVLVGEDCAIRPVASDGEVDLSVRLEGEPAVVATVASAGTIQQTHVLTGGGAVVGSRSLGRPLRTGSEFNEYVRLVSELTLSFRAESTLRRSWETEVELGG